AVRERQRLHVPREQPGPPAGIPLPRLPDHRRDEIQADDARATICGKEREIAGAAGEIQDPIRWAGRSQTDHPSLPPSIETEREDDRDQVVAIGDGGKETADVRRLAGGRGDRVAEAWGLVWWRPGHGRSVRPLPDLDHAAHHHGVRTADVLVPPG